MFIVIYMKERINKILETLKSFIIYNKQFILYVILSLIVVTLGRYFTIGKALTLKPMLIDLSLILLVGSFAYFNEANKQFRYLLITLCVFVLMAVINSIYYTFYNSFASFSLITALGQVGEVSDAVYENLEWIQIIYIIFPIIFILYNKYLHNRDYFNFVAKFEKGKELFVSIIITGTIVLITIVSTLNAAAYSRLSKQWNREIIVDTFGLITYQANDLINTLKPAMISLFGYDVALLNFEEFYEEYGIEKSNNKYTDIYKDKNLILVHMESINTFLVDLKVNDIEITPNINKIAKDGMYFSNFFPQIGVGTSSDTEYTLNTSLMPPQNGTAFVSYFDRDYITLTNLLKDKGYYTFSMHGNKANMWNRDRMYPSIGYDKFYAEPEFDIDETVGLGLSDSSFFRQLLPMLEDIEENNKKYMGTIITLTHHTPFKFDEDLFEDFDFTLTHYDEELEEDIVREYINDTKLGDFLRSAHYADKALGEFMHYVNESKYFDDTVFVFYGDHDPKLSRREFNRYYNYNKEEDKILTEEDEHEDYVHYDYYANELNKKTPLIIYEKNKKLKEEITDLVGMIDVMPTLGNMFGVYNKYALGNDIFSMKDENMIIFSNGNFLTPKLYYNSSKEEYKIFNLDDVIKEGYIEENKEYVEKVLGISNDISIHNLLKDEEL